MSLEVPIVYNKSIDEATFKLEFEKLNFNLVKMCIL